MAGKPVDNERKACDAVARALEEINATKRSNTHSPEDDKIGPPVEYVFDLSEKTYALEHTIIEAFSGQIKTDVDYEAFAGPIIDALDHHVPPPGKYHLSFSIHPSKGIKPKDIPTVQAAIIEWVRKTAAALHDEFPVQLPKNHRPGGNKNSRKETVAGVEVRLSREIGWWMPDKAKGRLFAMRVAPEDYEARRRERLKEAMNRKLPKLAGWKRDGARSVLLLENRDMALSNHVNILEAAEHALEGRDDGPDEVWLVDTTIEKEWTVWCLMRDGVSFPDEDAPVRYRDFNPDDLIEV